MNNSIVIAIKSLINGAYAQVTNKDEFNALTREITDVIQASAKARAAEIKALAAEPKTEKKTAKTKTKTTAKAATKTTAKTATAKVEKTEVKETKKREEVAQIALTNTKAIKALGLNWVEYKSGYVLGGDTKRIKDALTKMDGSYYNPRMKAENDGVWFFKKDAAKAAAKVLKVKIA